MSTLALPIPRAGGVAGSLLAGMAFGAALLALGAAAHLTCTLFCPHEIPAEICASAR